jgi:hypothetical protein
MAFETLEIEKWIYTTLKNDATLGNLLARAADKAKDYQIGIYSTVAPERDPVSNAVPQLPFVVFARNGSDSDDDQALCGSTYLTHPVYRVSVWQSSSGTVSFGSIKSIAERIDNLLHNQTATQGGIKFHCVRYNTEQPIVVQVDGRVDFALSLLFRFLSLK